MNLTKALLVSAFAFVIVVSLLVLRMLNFVGSEYDFLIRWVSTISLILTGVFVGVLISEKKIEIRPKITFLVVFPLGFFAAPFFGVGMLMLMSRFSFSRGFEPLIFGGSVTGYLLFYMLLWFWLKRKGVVKFYETNRN